VETAAASLTVSAASTNAALVPLANVVLGGSGANRTVTVYPRAQRVWRHVDHRHRGAMPPRTSPQASFVLSVLPVNDPPTIDAVNDITIAEDSVTTIVNLSASAVARSTSPSPFGVQATSGNASLLPDPAVNYASPAASGTLSLTPVTNATARPPLP